MKPNNGDARSRQSVTDQSARERVPQLENGPNISIVVPVYRSVGCLEELASRVRTAFATFGRSYELILVNDGSPDESWPQIRRLADEDRSVLGINLRRNVGQDNAIM